MNHFKQNNQMSVACAKTGKCIVRVGNTIHEYHRIEKEENSFENFLNITREIVRMEYEETILGVKERIDSTFTEIYGIPLHFKEKASDIWYKIKKIMEKTGMEITEIVKKIKDYLGYQCSMFRMEGEKKLPITSERILKAFELMKERRSIVVVEDALYF